MKKSPRTRIGPISNKNLGFKGFTVLGLVHTHYFLLGMILFLILLLQVKKSVNEKDQHQ